MRLTETCLTFGFALVLAIMPAQAQAPGAKLKDCADCPALVVVPARDFLMGSLPDEAQKEKVPDEMAAREYPRHKVSVPSAFAIGQFEVTRDEYAAFIADTKYAVAGPCRTVKPAAEQRKDADWPSNLAIRNDISWKDPGFAQTGTHPAVCVSWNDIQAYVKWLSQKTGHHYRLPTEAEWEYAARAGNAGARYGAEGDASFCTYMNGGDADFTKAYPAARASNTACSDGYVYTAPVGRFQPNAWGLYDVYGNVWEWVQDCMHDGGYKDAPATSAERSAFAGCERTSRGSSWFGVTRSFRAAFRVSDPPVYRGAGVGFRVVREIP